MKEFSERERERERVCKRENMRRKYLKNVFGAKVNVTICKAIYGLRKYFLVVVSPRVSTHDEGGIERKRERERERVREGESVGEREHEKVRK